MKFFISFCLGLFICLNAFCNLADTSVKPFVLGEVRELFSDSLQEKRVLNIYLPPGYYENDSSRYPVIYLLDGSADEDFIHVAGLVQFYNFPWINILPQSIVVGIANVDRRRDLTFPTSIQKDKLENPSSGSSAKFIGFLEGELQPYISRQYRTTDKKMIIGQSLGGLLATEILFKKPHLFQLYLIVSPSLWWDDQSLLRIQQQPIHASTQVYIGVGEEGKVMKSDAKALYKSLGKRMPPKHLYFDFLKKENHATILHKSIMRAFERWNAVKAASPGN